jgi:sulfate transport system substrate-binding protein
MLRNSLIAFGLAYLLAAAAWVVSSGVVRDDRELLNVACDPTRELWAEMNAAFVEDFARTTGQRWAVRQSHGGSGSQARGVIDGMQADVVTLALWSDTDAIRKAGLMAEGWQDRLPNRSLAFTSTIVFVVRRGNPKGVRDWPDLLEDGVTVIAPSPKTSGNGKWAFLAAWGAVVCSGGTEDDALAYVKELYKRVPVLDTSARNATMTFAAKKLGDVHLTWENEAFLEVKESAGALEIVYPPRSVLAEPHVAWVDRVVQRKGTEAVAKAYLDYLYTDAGQEIIAKHRYRPTNPAILAAAEFPPIELFPATVAGPTWDAIQHRYFREGGVFDQVLSK